MTGREQPQARWRAERLGDVASGEAGPQRQRVSSDGSNRSDEPGRPPAEDLLGRGRVAPAQAVLRDRVEDPELDVRRRRQALVDHLDGVLLGEEAREVPDEHRPVLLEDRPEPDDEDAHRRPVGEPAGGRLAEQLGGAVRAVGARRRPVVEQVPGRQVPLAGGQPPVRQAVVPFPAAHRAAGAHHDDAPDAGLRRGAQDVDRPAGRDLEVVVPVVVVLGLAREVQDHVLAGDGAPDGLEVGDRRLRVGDARDGVAAQAAELVAVGQVAEDEPTDQPARPGHQDLRLGHVAPSHAIPDPAGDRYSIGRPRSRAARRRRPR